MMKNLVIFGIWFCSISLLSVTALPRENIVPNATQYRILVLKSHQNFTSVNSFKRNFSVRLVDNSLNRDGGLKRNSNAFSDNENMENRSFLPRYSLLMQVLIFILCAAGVSAVSILCCIICLHSIQFFSRSTVIMSNDGRVHMMPNGVQIGVQRTENNETVLTLLSVHRHPWSPDISNEHFSFPLEKYDLPPSYDELSPTKEEDEDTVSSPPPPPYTPSFRMTEGAQMQDAAAAT